MHSPSKNINRKIRRSRDDLVKYILERQNLIAFQRLITEEVMDVSTQYASEFTLLETVTWPKGKC